MNFKHHLEAAYPVIVSRLMVEEGLKRGFKGAELWFYGLFHRVLLF